MDYDPIVQSWAGIMQFMVSSGKSQEEVISLLKEAMDGSEFDVAPKYVLGVYYSQIGQHSQAKEIFLEITRDTPDFAEGWFSLGAVFLNEGKLAESERAFRNHQKDKPDSSISLTYLGMAVEGQGRLDEAEKLFRRATEVDNPFPEAAVRLTNVLQKMGRKGEAEQTLKGAIEGSTSPDDLSMMAVKLYASGKIDESIDLHRRVLQLDPAHYDSNADLSGILTMHGRLEEAEVAFENALKHHPEDPKILSNYCALLMKLKRAEDAEAILRKVVSTSPDDINSLNNLAALLINRKNYSEAETYARKVLEKDSKNVFAWTNLGLVLDALKKPKEAEDAFRKALSIDPNFGQARQFLTDLLAKEGRKSEALKTADEGEIGDALSAESQYRLARRLESLGRLEEAEAAFLKALNLDPDFHEAWTDFGAFLIDQRRMMAAQRFLRKTLERKEDNPVAWYNLGSATASMGQDTEAVHCYRTAISHRPDYFKAHKSLGMVLARSGDISGAKASLENAARIQGDDTEVWDSIGVIQHKMGIVSKAVESFRKAVACDPKNAQALYNLGTALMQLGKKEGSDMVGKAFQQNPSLRGDVTEGKILDTILRKPEIKTEFEMKMRPVEGAGMLEMAKSALKTGDFQTGFSLLQASIFGDHNIPETWLLFSKTAKRLGKKTEGEAADKAYQLVIQGKEIPKEIWKALKIAAPDERKEFGG